MSLSVGDPVGSWPAVSAWQETQDWLNSAVHCRLVGSERPKEIERAWRVRQERLDLIGREDSSAAQAEDAKFEDSRGFIIDPTVDATLGQPGDA
jgi:hypothetical protein